MLANNQPISLPQLVPSLSTGAPLEIRSAPAFRLPGTCRSRREETTTVSKHVNPGECEYHSLLVWGTDNTWSKIRSDKERVGQQRENFLL